MLELVRNNFSLYAMVFMYLITGVNHFVNPKMYLKIIPEWLPNPKTINYLSGGLEIIFGLLLLIDTWRGVAAWCIIVLLILIFPANIKMAFDFYKQKNKYFLLTILRLPLQFILIYWALQFTS